MKTMNIPAFSTYQALKRQHIELKYVRVSYTKLRNGFETEVLNYSYSSISVLSINYNIFCYISLYFYFKKCIYSTVIKY